MTGKERVKRAIEFDYPDRIPIFADESTDVVRLSYVDPTGWMPRCRPLGDFEDEWHCLWHTVDDTIGHVVRPSITCIHQADNHSLPDPHLPRRWEHLSELITQHSDKYIVGNAQYLCYDRLIFLLGTTTTLEVMLTETPVFERLMDRIIDFELAIVDELADRGVDGIRFWDDIGAERGVIMGPQTWRKLFKPRYRRIFDHIQRRNLHIHWHSCGNCMDIMEDLIELGAQVFSIGEPFMMNVDKLAEKFASRVCFECSPDNRSILSKNNPKLINEAVDKLSSAFNSSAGGLILVAARDNFDCVSEKTRQIVIDAVNRTSYGLPKTCL